jgi:tripartite-type tricarboxylate transporter receptor subunit TctC
MPYSLSAAILPSAIVTGARLLLAAASVVSVLVPQIAQAQAWPTKQPIKLVAVFPPGGSVDQVARLLAPALQQRLGQPVIVDNKGGASGAIGTAGVVTAPADGYTFAVVFDTHGVNPALQPSLPFDTKRDLAAVSLIGTGAMVIATVATSPYKTFADVVSASKGGTSISYGSIGLGSLGHLALTMLAKDAKLDLVHVPYRGGGPLMTDAVAGHVPLAVGSVFLVKPHIDSGRLRALAVTTTQRSANLPGTPTVGERLRRFRRAGLVGGARPGEDAARNRQAHERRDQRRAQAARGGRQARCPGHHHELRHAGGGAGLHRRPGGHLVQGGQSQRHQGRLRWVRRRCPCGVPTSCVC